MKKVLALMALAVFTTGCANSNSGGSGHVVQAATPQQQESLLGQMKKLDGKWKMKGENGDQFIVFQTSSNGSVVREIMFPGQPDEMTNVYHMDGPSLMMTHYCAMGNQPRMRATACTNNQIAFAFDGVTNHTSKEQMVMRQLTITFKDHDHIIENWGGMGGGEKHTPGFELTRVN